jgi:hypothetical protein
MPLQRLMALMSLGKNEGDKMRELKGSTGNNIMELNNLG